MKKTTTKKRANRPAIEKPTTVLVLRTCKNDMSSPSPDANGFKWPESGPVTAPDWSSEASCGHGLHGALWGEGKGDLFCWLPDAKWLVVEVLESEIVDLNGKVKFPRGTVVFCGTRNNATNYIAARAPKAESVIGLISSVGDFEKREGADGITLSGGHKASLSGGTRATVSGGDGATVSGGTRATVSGGDGATVSGGTRATVSGGEGATVSGGDGATVSGGTRATVSGGTRATVSGGTRATVSGGDGATVSGGYGATVSGGTRATVSGGEGATVSGGTRATVSGGDGATVSGGYGATVSGGTRATVSGGEGAIITCKWWDGKRYRLALGYVGEDGIKPETKYKIVDGKFVEFK